MTKSIKKQAEEYSPIYPNGGHTSALEQLAFIAGAKARDEQWLKVVNELESLMYNNPNVRQDAYNQGVRDCIRRFTKAELMKEMDYEHRK